MAIPIVAMMSGCGSGVDDGFMISYLEKYHAISSPGQDQTIGGGYAVYFDLSDGMNYAYQDETLRCYLEAITNKTDGEWSSYGLGSSQIIPLNLTKKDLYNRVINESYKEIKAPIEKTFQQIVSEGKKAVLISDLEEYEQTMTSSASIQYSAYASQYFTDWLRRNGRIYFYVMNFQEPMKKGGMKEKHLYFVLFDDANGSLKEKVDQALVGRPVNYKIFMLSNNFYQIATNYASATQGGNYHDGNGDDLVSVVNEKDPSLPMYINRSYDRWEFYPCFSAWNEIQKNADALRDEGVPRADRFRHLLSNLFLRIINDDSYTIKNLKIRVTNVQEDFSAFAHYQNALTCAPRIVTEEGEKVVDMGGNKYTELYYDPVTGELLPEYDYKQPRDIRVVNDMFDVKLVPTEGDASLSEISIDFSDKFRGENLAVGHGDMLRIDVLIGDCDINYDKMKDYFVWKDMDRTNSSIAESLRNTLQADGVSPSGRLLYTYYIKTY